MIKLLNIIPKIIPPIIEKKMATLYFKSSISLFLSPLVIALAVIEFSMIDILYRLIF